MKKQIAILASMIAASGFTAFGQDWSVLQTSGNGVVWDEFTTVGVGHEAPAGDVNVELLWALTGTADPLGAGLATTGVSSTGAEATLATMLSSGGWNLAQNYASGSGSAALGTAETTTAGTVSKGGSIVAYNGGNPFQLTPSSTGATGSSIEEILIAFSGNAYSTASALGYSGMISEPIGLTAGDANSFNQQTSEGLTPFGVALTSVPEPTTLALAGLGGLSMLFLRRRKS